MASQDPKLKEPAAGGVARSVLAWLCLLVAFVLTVPAVVGFWAVRSVLDTQEYVDTVSVLSQDPDIQAAVARKVSRAISNNLDINAVVVDELGTDITDEKRAARVEARLRRTIPVLIDDVTVQVLASEQFALLWAEANREIHDGLIAALAGDPSGSLHLSNGELVLDTTEMVDHARAELATRGVKRANVMTVPASDTQIVLLSADELAEAQRVYKVANPLASWLIVIAAVLYLVGILLARRRTLMVIMTGIAVAFCGAGLLVMLATGQSTVQERFSDAQFSNAAGDFATTLTADLRTAAWVMLAVGIAVAVVVLVIRLLQRRASRGAAGDAEEPKVPIDV